jgi:hypothetical protein
MIRTVILVFVSIMILAFIALPASAQTGTEGTWSLGGGYWTLPNLDDEDNDINSAGFFASATMRSINYLLEVDYSMQDTGFLGLAADYIYPLSQDQNYFGGSAFVGAGYTYFSADNLSNESGFNAILGATFSDKFLGTIRYDILGNSQELLTFGVSYAFY